MTTVVAPLELTLPIRTGAGLNDRMHWTKRHGKVKRERGTACMMTRLELNRVPRYFSYPIIVTLTRLSSGELDEDNLAGSLKAIRDGIADAFECDDSKRSRLRFVYAQEKCKRGAFGVKVRIE